ncbi:hypothetical protein INR49_002856 [Caranx melampygus]|nr:hypothetical protein INR49_002856 [Caranx melampygus]
MVGGRVYCLCCLFTYSTVLLLGVCLYDVEASSCQRVIHKQVEDTVELLSCLPTDNVTAAQWKYGNEKVAEMDQDVKVPPQFTGRVELNPTTFSLTVKKLTLQDSGVFSFLSEVNNIQRETISITLHVHDPVTSPVLTENTTSHSQNGSCTVSLRCTSASGSKVSYNWTVREQTFSGSSSLQYPIRPEDGDVQFTCTVWNMVSEQSASITVKCSNTSGQPNTAQEKEKSVLYLSVAAGTGLLVVIAVTIGIWACLHRKGQAGNNANDLTVYADISDVVAEVGSSPDMKPCSVYETIDNRVNTGTPGPQTVYDKIQFSNMRMPSPSPYQEI